MVFGNPRVSWTELEQRLSGTRRQSSEEPPGDGGDSPAWTRTRGQGRLSDPGRLPPAPRPTEVVPYSELHCHSNFSFLDGASHPEELVEEAVRLGLQSLALTDHNGFYGSVRFARAAKDVGLGTIFGTELSLGLTRPQNGIADPEGNHLVVLARNPTGYASLARAISEAQLRGKEKGKPIYLFDELAHLNNGNWLVLTGCRKGVVPLALQQGGPEAAEKELRRLIDVFGRGNVAVELWDHGLPLDTHRNDALTDIAARASVFTVATANAHYASARRRPLATALSAVRARRSLDDMDGWLPAAATAHLRSGREQQFRFQRYRGAVDRAAEFGSDCAFDLELIAPQLPDCGVPQGHSESSWLRHLTLEGAVRRYGSRGDERIAGAYAQIDRELQLIDQLNFPGYFLIVEDIIAF